ncbi:MAG: ElyC/SanA/YdcF family protein [Bacteroidales bacterium]|nr:ElyC/SanA/YdcF family protein [Bacteroidales bacterium]
MKKKKTKISFWIILLIALTAILYANHQVEQSTKSDVYKDVMLIPKNKVGLLLGTSKLLNSGKPNLYFTYRINATIQLFNARKIEDVVISGDNSKQNYNEPQDMKDALIKAGFPAHRIYLDYAGFRTYDSVYRMYHIFGQTSFTIISQEFHNKRAIYLAKSMNLKAVGFDAKDVNAYNGFKTMLRERFARVKMFIDVLIKNEPKFLGDKIVIQ